jgi:hypothetical protein
MLSVNKPQTANIDQIFLYMYFKTSDFMHGNKPLQYYVCISKMSEPALKYHTDENSNDTEQTYNSLAYS